MVQKESLGHKDHQALYLTPWIRPLWGRTFYFITQISTIRTSWVAWLSDNPRIGRSHTGSESDRSLDHLRIGLSIATLKKFPSSPNRSQTHVTPPPNTGQMLYHWAIRQVCGRLQAPVWGRSQVRLLLKELSLEWKWVLVSLFRCDNTNDYGSVRFMSGFLQVTLLDCPLFKLVS